MLIEFKVLYIKGSEIDIKNNNKNKELKKNVIDM